MIGGNAASLASVSSSMCEASTLKPVSDAAGGWAARKPRYALPAESGREFSLIDSEKNWSSGDPLGDVSVSVSKESRIELMTAGFAGLDLMRFGERFFSRRTSSPCPADCCDRSRRVCGHSPSCSGCTVTAAMVANGAQSQAIPLYTLHTWWRSGSAALYRESHSFGFQPTCAHAGDCRGLIELE